MLISRILVAIALTTPGLLHAAGENTRNASLPEIKALVRFHSDSYGGVPDDISLPASTLLTDKQRRVTEGGLGRLPIRIYVRETPNQPRPTIEINIVDTRTNKPLAGYPARQEVGPVGILSFIIPLNPTDLGILVRTAKKEQDVKLGQVNSVSLHIDIDIPVNSDTNADGDLVLDCEDLLRQDDMVVTDVSEKINDTSTAGTRSVAKAYTTCLDQQTNGLADKLKPDDKATLDRIRQLLPDLAPVGFDSAINGNGGSYFSMLALASISVDLKQSETLNHLARHLGQSPVSSPDARKAVQTAFASAQASFKKLVAAPENAGDDVNVADLKKQFQSDLTKAQSALKQLQEIAAMLPDNSAMLLAQSALALLTAAQGYE